jgi:molybdopterin biosynthesis enzyme
VSEIGTTEIIPLRFLRDGRVEPLTGFAERGLAAGAAADGFAIIDESSEGIAAGDAVIIYLFPDRSGVTF